MKKQVYPLKYPSYLQHSLLLQCTSSGYGPHNACREIVDITIVRHFFTVTISHCQHLSLVQHHYSAVAHTCFCAPEQKSAPSSFEYTFYQCNTRKLLGTGAKMSVSRKLIAKIN